MNEWYDLDAKPKRAVRCCPIAVCCVNSHYTLGSPLLNHHLPRSYSLVLIDPISLGQQMWLKVDHGIFRMHLLQIT